MDFPSSRRQTIVSYLKSLRDGIIRDFESLEESDARFERKSWDYQKGAGGGEISVLRGMTFEKAAVNWSGVEGTKFPGSDSDGPFFATGVSLITHMRNPKAPTVHFNIRYLETPEKFWWGGGFDLTPMGFPYDDDAKHFHSVAEKTLKPFGDTLYTEYKKNAAEYFYIPHRKSERGVGGIFFDHVNTGDEKRDFAMWQSVGNNFLEAIMPIYRKRLHETSTESDRRLQIEKRGHYVEFNLIYDRGTRFGFLSGGNPEAILCSLPPLASW
ncbi:MAG: oxygen-dependent coproporphyrinogen oxidase [Bdellovibrionota bacterium]